ncbi:MAG: AraC family transcriptional regulator [Phycisphaerae bacterium]|nr:AraC family transcriptional regulator [Phycisphaerae bacterium]
MPTPQQSLFEPAPAVANSALGLRVQACSYSAARHMAMHAHDSASLTVIARGAVFEDSPHLSAFTACAGDCILKPAGSRHEDRFGDVPTRTLQIRILLSDETRPWLESIDRRGHALLRSAAVARPLLAILWGEGSTGCAAMQTTDDLLMDALGALAALVEERPRTPAWLARAEREIAARLPDAVSVAGLAQALDIHPAHLTRAFHAAHGCGVVEFVRRRRVQMAAEMLAASRAAICDIAQRAGFHDQAHLTRSFRDVLGTTPHAYRRERT